MRHWAWLGGLAVVAGCGPEELEPAYVDHDLGVLREGLTVGQAGGCDTSIVKGLSDQLVVELNCIAPASMTSFLGSDVVVTTAVEPYLEPGAAADLHLATAEQHDFITIDSAYRSVAQQYLLFEWYNQHLCGIQLAVAPGNSNHQSGRAIDVPSYSYWTPALQNHGWTWLGASDVVHFDHLASPDRRADSVLAFQRLWNKNNPGNLLAEDATYGPATDSALASSPATGFPVYGCGQTDAGQTHDAGAVDAGGHDGGSSPPPDAGHEPDGGMGPRMDAGSSTHPSPDAGGPAAPPAAPPVKVHQGCAAGLGELAPFALLGLAGALGRRRRA